MNKNIKKLSIIILMLLSAILLSTGMFMTVSFAQNNTSVAMGGVALRTYNDENGKYGLKFKGIITNYDSNLIYGMDIVPADLKGDASKYAELTAEPKAEEDVYYYECALTDIYASNRSRPFTARPFVKASDGTSKEYVGDWAEAKSIYTIATQALADQSYEYDTYIRTYLEEIVATVHGTATDDINGKYVYKTLTIDGEDIESFDKKFTGNVNFNTAITMVKEGDASKTITAYPIITMKDSNGADITGQLTQVDSRGNYKLSTSELSDFELSYSLAGEEIVSLIDCDITANKATYSQDGTVTLDGQQVGAYFSSNWCDTYDSAYVAIEGEYGVGTYIDVEFTGNNMPYVCFFADNINGNIGSNGGNGVMFFNGVMYNSSDVDSSTGLPRESAYWRGGQLIVYGPNRMSSTNYGHFAEMNWLVKGYESGDVLNESIYKATQMGLRENPNTKYKMSIGTYDAGGVLGIDFKLVEAETGVSVCQFIQTIDRSTIPTSSLSAGNIILYANLKDSSSSPNRFTSFKYSKPYQSNVVYSTGTSVNTDGSVTLTAGGSNGKGVLTDDAWHSTISKGYANNYVGFEGGYTVGEYIDFYFTGNNMPIVTLFAGEVTHGMGGCQPNCTQTTSPVSTHTDKQTGYLISNGGFYVDNRGLLLSESYYVFGPNRIDKTLYAGDVINPEIETYKTNVDCVVLEDSVNYKYVVGSRVESEKVVVVFELYKLEGTTYTELYKGTYQTGKTVDEVQILGDSVIAYAGVKGNSLTTTFKYSDVYLKNA